MVHNPDGNDCILGGGVDPTHILNVSGCFHKSSILIGFSLINHSFWGINIHTFPMRGLCYATTDPMDD